jgi:hypothetical protein
MNLSNFTTGQTRLIHDWHLVVTADMVLQRQGANPAKIRLRQPRLVALAERAVAEASPWIRPQVAYQILKVQHVQSARVTLTNGEVLEGVGIARKLTGAEFMIAAVASVGAEIEQHILRVTKDEPTYALALDGYGTAAIGALTVAMKKFFADRAAEVQFTTTSPLYPGTNEWELAEAQSKLFSLVDASAIGVNLNSSFLMTPYKSVSLVIAVGQKMKPAGQPCEECGASATCRHRLSEP